MKATLEFDMDEQGNINRHYRCIKSNDMASFIWELKHNFWRKWKHNEEDFNLDSYKEALQELMEEYNIHPNELW